MAQYSKYSWSSETGGMRSAVSTMGRYSASGDNVTYFEKTVNWAAYHNINKRERMLTIPKRI